MDRNPPPVRIPLHSDVSFLAQRRRELLCETNQKAPQARRVPLPPRSQRCHPSLPRRHQCKPKALYLDQGPQQNHRRRQTREPNVRFDPLGSTMSEEELKTELERLRNENAALKKGASLGTRLKVSEKGAVSVYGLGRFPVTLYKEQWLKLLDMSADIRAFIAANEAQLKK